MANVWARDRANWFYLGFGLFALAVVLVGFSTTYIIPMARRSFNAPWVVHLHGASALGWVLLLIFQARLVGSGRTPLHRRIGQAAIPLALLIWATGIATAIWAAKRDLAEQGTAATSSLAGTAIGLSLYLLLVIAAVAMRRRPDWHKRLIMLATIQVLWPAFFRLRHLLPTLPHPDIWLALVVAYMPVVVAALRDQWRYGQVHPVWLFVAPALILEQSVEFVFFDKGVLRGLGQWLYALLG
ncbi:MAG TPA: hypothetical protein VNA29_02740 [Sphingomicrobium sp.]|nr:hypothetical protein [Sphingomicrobium sp.]